MSRSGHRAKSPSRSFVPGGDKATSEPSRTGLGPLEILREPGIGVLIEKYLFLGRALGALMQRRLNGLHNFFSMIDLGIGAFVRGEPFPAQNLQNLASRSSRAERSS